MHSPRQGERSRKTARPLESAHRLPALSATFQPTLPMNLLPLILTASVCLLFSLAVYFLRERLQQSGRNPASRGAVNELPFDRAA